MPAMGSTVSRRQLGRRLRRLREQAGKSDRDVEAAGLVSKTTLWRIENGKTRIKVADARALCWLYGADQALTDAIAALALKTAEQGLLEDFGGDLPEWFGMYVELESTATEIRIYDPEVVHGLFQTPDYVQALYDGSGQPHPQPEISRQIKLRQSRQKLITSRKPPLRTSVIFGEGVLTRQVGGPAVMAEQKQRLTELAALPHVDIWILTWRAGAHAAMHTGPFTVLDFASPDDPAVAYIESHTGARYLEKPVEVDAYRRIHELCRKQAVPLKEYL
ncbi:helix-turn-helix domain-containing protein [Catenuloplanes japonicus]|uniref:helix-turn-helix domain-containing protein n=1 Tax=Catenuloplanes japonicus TaxID=33876 RepID=UPI0005255D96|nr:helix-turn-helix transcriptional regulator [Catenuloplanes japonicus]